MADVIHRTTLKVERSVHTPDYPTRVYIHNPDLSALVNVSPVYWKIDGDLVLEMNDTEKAAVDAAVNARLLTAAKIGRKTEVRDRSLELVSLAAGEKTITDAIDAATTMDELDAITDPR